MAIIYYITFSENKPAFGEIYVSDGVKTAEKNSINSLQVLMKGMGIDLLPHGNTCVDYDE